MSWTTMKQWWATVAKRRGASQDRIVGAVTPAVDGSSGVASVEDCVTANTGRNASGTSSRSRTGRTLQRTREWRRRALLRKGAGLYSKITSRSDFVSLAMLDEDGAVVAWFEHSADRERSERSMLQRHVSQLYTPEDIALGIPVRDLCTATVHGSCTGAGWRRGSDGAKFWATVVIKPMLLRDGRLQGFSHTTHRAPAPWKDNGNTHEWSWKWFVASKASKRPGLGQTHNTDGASMTCTNGRPSDGTRTSTHITLAILTFVAMSVPTLSAAEGARRVPDHARVADYGSGWDCMHGYRRVADACKEILLPANAFLVPSGDRWRCERGYLAVDEQCVEIEVPANAYLDDTYGTGWSCERGFREAKGVCVQIQVPANAREVDSSYGVGWECNHGFALSSGSCQPVQVPENGYLTRTGADWKCARGFAKSEQTCIRIALPPHAYVDMQGNGWACERGFRKTSTACIPVELPANAHLDSQGDRWQCNRGFQVRAGACVSD